VKPGIISISVSRWIFSGCIIFSFLLLAKDWYSARKIIRSRDISFAYTNVLSNRWYSIRGGYAYFCLFDRLGDSRHAWDSIAFFVFFSFKGTPFTTMVNVGWKRLMLAEGPRQVLNAITLYSVAKDNDFSFNISVYQKKYSTVQGVVMSFMLLTVAIWALSFIRLLVAGLLYWPLLCCHIRGNLKEYCCHKVDKRITKILIEKRQKQRDQRQPEKKGTMTIADMGEGKGQPTLPKVELDGDGDSIISMPLYPLTRTDTTDSRAGLLQRTDSVSSSSTNPYLTRTNTGLSDPRSLARTNTNMTDRSQPSLPRQPTLPHLVSDFSVPERPRPTTPRTPTTPRSLPRIDTRMSPPQRPGTSNSSRSAPYGPPARSMTGVSMTSSRTESNSAPWQNRPGNGASPRNYNGTPRRLEQTFSPGSAYSDRTYGSPQRPYTPGNSGGNGGLQRPYTPSNAGNGGPPQRPYTPSSAGNGGYNGGYPAREYQPR
jgi:Fungal potassium channel